MSKRTKKTKVKEQQVSILALPGAGKTVFLTAALSALEKDPYYGFFAGTFKDYETIRDTIQEEKSWPEKTKKIQNGKVEKFKLLDQDCMLKIHSPPWEDFQLALESEKNNANTLKDTLSTVEKSFKNKNFKNAVTTIGESVQSAFTSNGVLDVMKKSDAIFLIVDSVLLSATDKELKKSLKDFLDTCLNYFVTQPNAKKITKLGIVLTKTDVYRNRSTIIDNDPFKASYHQFSNWLNSEMKDKEKFFYESILVTKIDYEGNYVPDEINPEAAVKPFLWLFE
ncbi:hypothetical protein AGMMS49944_16770 [Spirochaetia bacterium]|nr:hypothetical protein AGMMS49944_16770 [Spirochaetia bacterium]